MAVLLFCFIINALQVSSTNDVTDDDDDAAGDDVMSEKDELPSDVTKEQVQDDFLDTFDVHTHTDE